MTLTAAQQINFEAHVSTVHANQFPRRTRQWVINHLVEKGITADKF